ncbi:hypothetical protein GCM10023196_007390 [Actinoallomurus vinaceus]|uniref:Protein kinase domain-containing protein n=1 Tax=Actinoallomurus vinaceus TaxID=1080074 RepID=A0ABP8U336_9ACTN
MRQGLPLQPGDPAEIAGYRVVGRLGVGGQGTVFLGHAPDGSAVAVKVLHTRFDGDAKARARFAREIGAARRVASFCTARVLAAEVAGDTAYLVSELIAGPALSAVLAERGPLTGDDLHRLAVGTATALGAIHQAGVVHRDLKPSNILLGPQGPRVIDFGIARAMDATGTMTSQIVGTPAYMAPEQVAGEAVGPATDVFAWGATMTAAATGRPPFGQDTVPAMFNRILTQPPDLGDMAEPLRGIAAACLAKAPEARPSAEELLHWLLGGSAPELAAGPTRAAETVDLGPSPRTQELSPAATVRWRPPYPESTAMAWVTYAVGLPFGLVAVGVALGASGTAKLLATPVALLFFLALMWNRQVAARPLRAATVEVDVDETGVAARVDTLDLRWEWRSIDRVAVSPLGSSTLWGSMTRFSGIYAVRRPGAAPLDRLPVRRRFPVWGLRSGDGWELLLPLGRTTDPQVGEVTDRLRRYAGERWTPFF